MGNTNSTNTTTCAAANVDSVACAANKEQHPSLAGAVSPNVALHSAASRQQCSFARVISANTAVQSTNSWQHCSTANTDSTNAAVHLANSQQPCFTTNANSADNAARLANSRQCCSAANASCRCRSSDCLAKAFTHAAAACRCCSPASTARKQQSCLYCKRARVALRCCHHKVWQASRMWRRLRQRHRKMV